jgi:predicted phage terminase large subunit-like protein
MGTLSDDDHKRMLYAWRVWARDEQLPPPGKWLTWLIKAGRGWGKALDIRTPIPTPNGWTTMLDLRVGDQVYSESGQPCMVTFVSPIQLGNRCSRIRLNDTTEIIADAEHRWLTTTHQERKQAYRHGRSPTGKVRVTTGIGDTVRHGKRRDLNHAIQNTKPLEAPDIDLPIHPYMLGYWLGDGDSKSSAITMSADDGPETLSRFEAVGYKHSRPIVDKRTGAWSVNIGIMPKVLRDFSLHSRLRRNGLFGNKHIPRQYLRASPSQRFDLLCGLMDSDGTIGKDCNSCTFDVMSKRLADGLAEVVVSLGWRAHRNEKRALLDGKDCGTVYRVIFTPHVAPFRLDRKRFRFKTGKKQAQRIHQRMITAVDPCESVAVRCIAVDSPSHLFLCSRAMVPTHNTRCGSEFVREQVESNSAGRIALLGRTAADVRDVMVEGNSGILARSHPGFRPIYNPSKRRLTWPNGAIATCYSGDEPDTLRGPEHDLAWIDEFAAYRYAEDTWDNLQLGLRIGKSPRTVITTTPRPIKIIRELIKDPTTTVTGGPTYHNLANLSQQFRRIIRKFEGTTLGRQELLAELLEDIPGALWKRTTIDAQRVPWTHKDLLDLMRIVVAIDPATTSKKDSDDTGIIVAGLGSNGHAYVLDDVTQHDLPDVWARAAIDALEKWKGDRIVAEVNNGGDLVESVLRHTAPDVPYSSVHASRGKRTRAEPIAALYEQGKVHHLGTLSELEDQMCTWLPLSEESPDRVDALVWALTELFEGTGIVVVSSLPSEMGDRW